MPEEKKDCPHVTHGEFEQAMLALQGDRVQMQARIGELEKQMDNLKTFANIVCLALLVYAAYPYFEKIIQQNVRATRGERISEPDIEGVIP